MAGQQGRGCRGWSAIRARPSTTAATYSSRRCFFAHLASGAAVDEPLADQLVPFLALGAHASRFTSPTLSRHLEAVAWTTRPFLPATIELVDGRPACVVIASKRAESALRRPSSDEGS